jgi:hypothetical protein
VGITVYDIVQVAGSLLILVGFVASLVGWIRQSSYLYLASNAIGSAVLTATAIASSEPGFILLEGVWALVSVFSIVRRATGRSVGTAH